ncbi:family 20 glycosylhydrolase [Paracnuella aquatica]|uniref:family 20 glycosylhydrolase n=1 Tax=Paracnuella aquatica TaxID=2268757 RepID=UPI000DEEC8A8|nr:family 20 glycosylhydrolase [Paracnuella aquatica]RPD45582.1 beta-N-acetylhexosaminidase [Paracnuella aquatica]
MKSLIFVLNFFICFPQLLLAQTRLHDSLFSTYYHQRVSHFKSLPQTRGDIIFLGNSINDGAEWNELFGDLRIKNRGISGDVSAGILHRIDEVAARKPAMVFLMIGTNDLARKVPTDSLQQNIFSAVRQLRQQSPATQVYVQSILPVNDVYRKFGGHTGNGAVIKRVNAALAQNAASLQYTYIDLHTPFSDAAGKLKASFTNDGLHLNGEAYLFWKHLLYPYVFDATEKPALIPLPQQLQWKEGFYTMTGTQVIVATNAALQREAARLQELLTEKEISATVQKTAPAKGPHIELRLGNIPATIEKDAAYQLEVTPQKITITANAPQGIFYGVQTLLQLMRNSSTIDACNITDKPAFSWRGYMVDVGRNYQSMQLLKQQIDVMAKYKLNVFHFHLTEDIAWRLAIKQYPQLTAPENMIRNEGQFYSEADMKELIAYCKDRYITLIPEIDMPGHSAAFTRAMKWDMQSDSGLIIVKNIVKELVETYDVPLVHIGADEVKITNKAFVPEVTAFLQGMGKKVMGWEPGGNFTANTIRQLWMDDGGKISRDTAIQYVDSRHLYLNHMDPLESVVTIFNRRIGGNEVGSKTALGGIICLWPDRRVEHEEDALKMSAAYPAMLAFAERSWRGGGREGWVANVGAPGDARTKAFAAFEGRLLDHKRNYFQGLPFPYVRQTNTIWKLFGPYQNGGNLLQAFAPEEAGFDASKVKPSHEVVGGTVVIRHWWAPLIEGAVADAKENTTWYATTRIWSDDDRIGDFWIGFNNISRSPATDSPLPGTWSNLESRVWVNGDLIAPPRWKRGGHKGHPEVPLVDEGYEYREPTKVALKKGWNDVLVKLPIASFKGKDWQNPVKWMFTFIPVGE